MTIPKTSSRIAGSIFAIIFVIGVFTCITSISYALIDESVLTYENFDEQIKNYNPVKRENVSQKDFNYGVMVIDETKSNVKNDPDGFNRADYFNVLSVFLTLKESEQNIKLAFEKFKNSEGSCEYFIAFEDNIKTNKKYDIIRKEFNKQAIICKSTQEVKVDFDIIKYCKNNNLNSKLVETIKRVHEADIEFRNSTPIDWEKQNKLDKQNQLIIDSLYNAYKMYIGNTLVGGKFESTMWAVIQHSNINMMERYLPVVHQSYIDGELALAPFKMLLDRYYGLKHGYQLFGSQSGFGFEFADDKTKKDIMLKYGIE